MAVFARSSWIKMRRAFSEAPFSGKVTKFPTSVLFIRCLCVCAEFELTFTAAARSSEAWTDLSLGRSSYWNIGFEGTAWFCLSEPLLLCPGRRCCWFAWTEVLLHCCQITVIAKWQVWTHWRCRPSASRAQSSRPPQTVDHCPLCVICCGLLSLPSVDFLTVCWICFLCSLMFRVIVVQQCVWVPAGGHWKMPQWTFSSSKANFAEFVYSVKAWKIIVVCMWGA